MTKEEIIDIVNRSGCKMLRGKFEGDETKEEIIAYLKKCKCPVISKLL